MLNVEERSILTAVLEESIHTAAALTSHADEVSKVPTQYDAGCHSTDVLHHLADALIQLRLARGLLEEMLQD
jgi:hypothetical protein